MVNSLSDPSSERQKLPVGNKNGGADDNPVVNWLLCDICVGTRLRQNPEDEAVFRVWVKSRNEAAAEPEEEGRSNGRIDDAQEEVLGAMGEVLRAGYRGYSEGFVSPDVVGARKGEST